MHKTIIYIPYKQHSFFFIDTENWEIYFLYDIKHMEVICQFDVYMIIIGYSEYSLFFITLYEVNNYLNYFKTRH